MRVLLSLDLSTTCTGYAFLCLDTKRLLQHGFLKPRVKNPKLKGISKFTYPKFQLMKMRDLAEQIKELIDLHKPEAIAIEEVVSHKSRLTGKVLDGLHFVVIDRIFESIEKIKYVDVSGSTGWRPHFNIRLSSIDKLENKEHRKYNKRFSNSKLPIVDWKTLSCRYVNRAFDLELNAQTRVEDGDVADAIMVGLYYLDWVELGKHSQSI